MALRERLLPMVDRVRAIPGRLGLHRYRVFVRVTTYTGARPGSSAPTVTETELLVNAKPPHVREVRMKDMVAGTRELKQVEFEVGPLTPEFPGGGVTDDMADPQNQGVPSTTHFRVTGPGLPAAGVLCVRTDDTNDKPFRTMIRLRSTSRKAP